MAGQILAGVAAGVATFFVALHVTAPESRAIVGSPTSTTDDRHPPGAWQAPTAGSSHPSDRPFSVPFQQVPGSGAGANADEPLAFHALRNRVLDETGRAMQRREVSVMDCLAGVELVGAQKIRFAAHVRSTPAEAIVGPWRFLEVADGQALPDAFPECAESALGTVGRINPGAEGQFPRYEGEISTVYRIEAP